jgi:hypothetical protein
MILFFIFIVYFLAWLFNGPTALSNFQDAKTELIIPPSSLPAGVNVNFSYSVWLYIDDWSYRYGSEKIIFCRGNKKLMPGLILSPIENNAVIKMAMIGTDEMFSCTVQDIPIQKWTNMIISLNNRSLDTYVNGKLVKTCILPSPAYVDDTTSIYFNTFIRVFRVYI